MINQNVDDDWPQQHQRDGHETVQQQQNGAYQLKREHRSQEIRGAEGAQKLTGGSGGRERLRDEVQKPVQSHLSAIDAHFDGLSAATPRKFVKSAESPLAFETNHQFRDQKRTCA